MSKVGIKIFPNVGNTLSETVANIIIDEIDKNNQAGKKTVLGLATGNTPLDVYRQLIKKYQEKKVDFTNVISFNLDEYYGLPPDHHNSYNYFMRSNLFYHINVKPENIHVPQGLIPAEDVDEWCKKYEDQIAEYGGIDIQLLGIGRDGHIGFNEPHSAISSRTRMVDLNPITLNDAVREFGDVTLIPTKAITMGVQTIMKARRVMLIATGDQKAQIVREALEDPPTGKVVAAYLQAHSNAEFYLDEAAAKYLRSQRMPWLEKKPDWSNLQLRLKAIHHLLISEALAQSKITPEILKSEGLDSLVENYKLDSILEEYQKYIKERLVLPEIHKQKVMVFSPHPDDDIIGIGGIMQKLIKQENQVQCVYLNSAAQTVLDNELSKFSNAMRLSEKSEHSAEILKQVNDFILKKMGSRFGIEDPEHITALRAVIKQAEAECACHTLGLSSPEFCPSSIESVLDQYNPDIVFVCGDLTDPNSAHRKSLNLLEANIKNYNTKFPSKQIKSVYLYYSDSPTLEIHEVDHIIPLTEAEISRKHLALFQYQTQNYKFPLSSTLLDKAKSRDNAISSQVSLVLGSTFSGAACEVLKRLF